LRIRFSSRGEKYYGHVTSLTETCNPENKLYLSEFEIKLDDDQKPIEITCPQGQMVSVEISKQKKAFVAHFSDEQCDSCPMVDHCPAQKGKRDQRYHLRITKEKALAAIRQRLSLQFLQEGRNLRAAVESTVKSIRKPLSGGKLGVRGLFRVFCMMIGPAVMTNVRRIQRYLESPESKKEIDKTEKVCQDKPFFLFSVFIITGISSLSIFGACFLFYLLLICMFLLWSHAFFILLLIMPFISIKNNPYGKLENGE